MIIAMHYASRNKQYEGETGIELFEKYFPANYNFDKVAEKVFTN